MIRVDVQKKIHELLRIGVLEMAGMEMPADNGDRIWELLGGLSTNLYERYANCSVGEIDGVQNARTLYRAIGIDPTKTRPSSEALLRRSIKGKGVYRIHPLVDLLNYVSLKYLIPVGLYDVSKIRGISVRIQIGEDGWGFDGIRKARVNVAGRMCVADTEGPFGSPTSDSLRTSIDGNVSGALVLLYQSRTNTPQALETTLIFAQSVLTKYMGGKPIQLQLL
jgi:DNA/RNA-binding domain of Phe-tRNA-synthetase-like protein